MPGIAEQIAEERARRSASGGPSTTTLIAIERERRRRQRREVRPTDPLGRTYSIDEAAQPLWPEAKPAEPQRPPADPFTDPYVRTLGQVAAEGPAEQAERRGRIEALQRMGANPPSPERKAQRLAEMSEEESTDRQQRAEAAKIRAAALKGEGPLAPTYKIVRDALDKEGLAYLATTPPAEQAKVLLAVADIAKTKGRQPGWFGGIARNALLGIGRGAKSLGESAAAATGLGERSPNEAAFLRQLESVANNETDAQDWISQAARSVGEMSLGLAAGGAAIPVWAAQGYASAKDELKRSGVSEKTASIAAAPVSLAIAAVERLGNASPFKLTGGIVSKLIPAAQSTAMRIAGSYAGELGEEGAQSLLSSVGTALAQAADGIDQTGSLGKALSEAWEQTVAAAGPVAVMMAPAAAVGLYKGQRVRRASRRGNPIESEVVRVNQNGTAVIKDDDGTTVTKPVDELTAVPEATQTSPEPRPAPNAPETVPQTPTPQQTPAWQTDVSTPPPPPAVEAVSAEQEIPLEEEGQGREGQAEGLLTPPTSLGTPGAGTSAPGDTIRGKPVTIKQQTATVNAIYQKYREAVDPQADFYSPADELGFVGDIPTGLTFRNTPQGRSLANEIREQLGKGAESRIKVVGKGHKLYATANGEDLVGEFGADTIVAAIKGDINAFANRGAAKRAEKLYDWATAQLGRVTPEELYELKRFLQMQAEEKGDRAAARAAKPTPIPADQLSVGDKFKIGGDEHTISEIDPDTGAVKVDDGTDFEVGPDQPLMVDAGTFKKAATDGPDVFDTASKNADLFGRPVYERQGREQKAMDFAGDISGQTPTATGWVTKEGKLQQDPNLLEEPAIGLRAAAGEPTAIKDPPGQGQFTPPPEEPTAEGEQPNDGTEGFSAQNAFTEAMREKYGMDERARPTPRTWEEVTQVARAAVTANPLAADVLIEEVKNKPRSLEDSEAAMIDQRGAVILDEYNATLEKLDAARKAGNDAEVAAQDAAETVLRGKLTDTFEALESAGTEQGRAFNFRKAFLRTDWSLAAMLQRKRKASGAEPTPVEAEEIARQAKTIADLQAKLEAREADKSVEEENARLKAAVEELKAQVAAEKAAKPKTGRRSKESVELDAAWADFAKKGLGKLFSGVGGLPVPDGEVFASALRLVKALVKSGIRTLADIVQAVGKKVGKSVTADGQAVLDQALQKALADETASRAEGRKKAAGRVDPENFGSIRRAAQKIGLELVREGETDPIALVRAIHEELKAFAPDLTERQALDALSGYGDFRMLDPDAAKTKLRDIKGQLQQAAKLDDLIQKQPLQQTGPQRRTQSDTERRMAKIVNEAKRTLGVVVTDPATQLRSAQQAAERALENAIADIEHEIESGQLPPTKTPIEASERMKELRKRRDELVAVRDQLRKERGQVPPKAKPTDAQRLAAMEAGLDRAIAVLKADLESGVLFKPKTGVKLTNPAIEAKRATLEALQERRQAARDALNPKLTPEQKWLRAYKAQLKKAAAEWARKLADGDFSKKPKVEHQVDAETVKLKADLDAVKKRYNDALAQDTWNKRSLAGKLVHGAGAAHDLSRAIGFGLEFSIVGMQGLPNLIVRPKKVVQAARAMFESLLSGERTNYWMEWINSHSVVKSGEAKRAKLPLTGLDATKMTATEENYVGAIVGKLPGIRNFHRAATVFLDIIRIQQYTALTRGFGVDTDAGRKSVAHAVGAFTGRSMLGPVERNARVMAHIFLAARWVASRMQMVTGEPLIRGTGARKVIAAEYARQLAGFAALYSMAYLAFLGDGDDEEPRFELDPRSSNFGKIRVGENTWIDITAGLASMTTFLVRTLTGETKTRDGDIEYLREGMRPAQWFRDASNSVDTEARSGYGDVTFNFLRSKLAPLPAAAFDILAGEDVVHNKATPLSTAAGLVTPITFASIVEAMIDEGVPRGTAIGILALFGANPRSTVRQEDEWFWNRDD